MCQVQGETTQVFCDSSSAMSIAKNPTMHGHTKHIDIPFHFIRNSIAKGEINLEYYSTNEHLANVLTKALLIPRHEYLCSMLGVGSS